MSAEMKEKCYLWATRIRTYADDTTDEVHFASLKATSHIGEFLQPKSKKPFNVKDYPSFIPFLDQKKLASHSYIFSPVCYSDHWWMWVADVKRKNFIYLTPITRHLRYVISRIRVYAGAPLKRKDREIEPPYIDISGQKTPYDCAIYVMKWLEIIEPQNVEVDHFRVEYTFRILFYDMNRDRDAVIKGSETMILSKPSATLLSPYCQVDSYDIDSDSD
ncbi:hypothetical protein Ahy_A10g050101 [Arachis hypogaea]|uniref:Ubiquitin-like protease family profile domain-containing protein n=1 Tax=Arachis hypogaea TaxID=3818 RepID=A0A445B8L0_ARAHY|nr:hypothetical protein Ahy_A10g050101 [Arachis hypogaea]